ncbi:uncharacterized protein C2845_PM11G09440 [Panicum miliaceum]|uniref:HMA domain-containing protein n=1 Tax=Panicum miliaceum TaxID=4540 RepID=A0A3L6RUU1_PANMI|nr:uncharacterized protein C2845_PM11G09440 [Panicum miliaceum]
MATDRCRSRALALVAATGGVDSVALTGDGKDQVVVVGEGVDSIKLTSALRRKVGGAELVQVGEDKEEEKKPAPAPAPAAAPEYYSQWYYQYHPYPPPPPPPHLAGAVYDHRAAGYGYYSRADTCSIM